MNGQDYYRLDDDESGGSRRKFSSRQTSSTSASGYANAFIICLLSAITVLLGCIFIVLLFLLNFAYQNQANIESLVASFDVMGGVADRAGPLVSVLSDGASGVDLNMEEVMRSVLPTDPVQASEFLSTLAANARGALGLMSAAHENGLVDKVSDAMGHPAVGSMANVVEWIGNRTTDGSVDNGAAFVRSTIEFGMNFTAEESQAFAAIEQVTTAMAPFLHNVNELVQTLNVVQESVFFSEMSRRFYVIIDQFTEGPRMTMLVENTHKIYRSLASSMDYLATDDIHQRFNLILSVIPKIADMTVHMGETFRDGGLNLRLGEKSLQEVL